MPLCGGTDKVVPKVEVGAVLALPTAGKIDSGFLVKFAGGLVVSPAVKGSSVCVYDVEMVKKAAVNPAALSWFLTTAGSRSWRRVAATYTESKFRLTAPTHHHRRHAAAKSAEASSRHFGAAAITPLCAGIQRREARKRGGKVVAGQLGKSPCCRMTKGVAALGSG